MDLIFRTTESMVAGQVVCVAAVERVKIASAANLQDVKYMLGLIKRDVQEGDVADIAYFSTAQDTYRHWLLTHASDS